MIIESVSFAIPDAVPSSVVKVTLTVNPVVTVPSNIDTVTVASGSLSLNVYDVEENPTNNAGDGWKEGGMEDRMCEK